VGRFDVEASGPPNQRLRVHWTAVPATAFNPGPTMTVTLPTRPTLTIPPPTIIGPTFTATLPTNPTFTFPTEVIPTATFTRPTEPTFTFPTRPTLVLPTLTGPTAINPTLVGPTLTLGGSFFMPRVGGLGGVGEIHPVVIVGSREGEAVGLDEVDGVGPARRRRLIAAGIADAAALAAAGEEEVAAALGLTATERARELIEAARRRMEE
jgi:hypothetical protein